MNFLYMTELESEGQAEVIDDGRSQGHILYANLAVKQANIETILEPIDILTQIFD